MKQLVNDQAKFSFQPVSVHTVKRGITFHSLLVTRCKIACCSLQNLLVTRCRSCLLPKITRYSLQKISRYSLRNSLVTRCRSCLLQKNHQLLVGKFARYSLQNCSLQKITPYSLQNSLVPRCRSFSLQNSLITHCTANFNRYLLCKVTNKNQFQLNLVMDDKI